MRIVTLVLIAMGTLSAQQAAKPKPVAAKSWKDLKFKPLKEIRLPEITSVTLDNGMKVYLLEDHELPLVRGFAYIRTGNVYDAADRTGLSDIFGELLRTGGTKSHTPDQMNELLEGVAASVEGGVGETAATIAFNSLTEHADTVMGAMKEILTEPLFSQEKLDVLKNQYRGSISRRNDQASGIASREFERLLYGKDTPWGRQMEYETLDRISRDDVVKFYERYYYPSNITMAVYGDFVSSTMQAKIQKLFGEWKAKQPPTPPVPPVTAKATPGVFFAEKTDVNQTFFRIGHLGGKLSDKDYPALDVMSDILGGGGFRSRLMQKVRSDLGYAYGINANWGAEYDHTGTFSIGGSVKAENTVDAFQVIREEVDKMRTTEVTDEELRIAKESTLNSFVFNFDTPAKTIGRLMRYEYYGYPKDWIFQYQKAVAAVTKADVLRVAKTYIKPEEFTIVAVGPKDLGKPITALNLPVNKIDLTIPQPKQEVAKADGQSLARGKQLIQKLQTAVGGAAKLAAVKDYSHTADVAILSAPGGLKVKQSVKVLLPQIRYEQVLPFGSVVVYSDGKGGGFMSSPQGTAALPPQGAKQLQDELFRLPMSLWLSDQAADRQVNATGPDTFEITDKQGNWAKIQLNGEGLIAKLTFKSMDMSGPVDSEATYSDWKDVDGVKLPFKMSISQKGKVAAEVTFSEYKLNSGLKAEDVGKKP